MARTPRRLIGKRTNSAGDVVWVYQAGRGYLLSYRNEEHDCHPSIRSVADTHREALLVYGVDVPDFARID